MNVNVIHPSIHECFFPTDSASVVTSDIDPTIPTINGNIGQHDHYSTIGRSILQTVSVPDTLYCTYPVIHTASKKGFLRIIAIVRGR